MGCCNHTNWLTLHTQQHTTAAAAHPAQPTSTRKNWAAGKAPRSQLMASSSLYVAWRGSPPLSVFGCACVCVCVLERGGVAQSERERARAAPSPPPPTTTAAAQRARADAHKRTRAGADAQGQAPERAACLRPARQGGRSVRDERVLFFVCVVSLESARRWWARAPPTVSSGAAMRHVCDIEGP